MCGVLQRGLSAWQPVAFAVLLAALAAIGGCQQKPQTDTTPLDQAGMWFSNVQELRPFNLTQEEVSGLVEARQAGFSDENCIELVKLARQKHESFTDGDAIASLLQAGVSSQTIMTLAHMNQLGPWSGDALTMHLAKLSDAIVLQVARRRVAGLPVLSGEKLAQLRDAGFSEAQLSELIANGTTDAQADRVIDVHNRASGRGFVHQHRGH
jgi:hypothetical protein